MIFLLTSKSKVHSLYRLLAPSSSFFEIAVTMWDLVRLSMLIA